MLGDFGANADNGLLDGPFAVNLNNHVSNARWDNGAAYLS